MATEEVTYWAVPALKTIQASLNCPDQLSRSLACSLAHALSLSCSPFLSLNSIQFNLRAFWHGKHVDIAKASEVDKKKK
jgi:hypothetical protein